MDVLKSFKMELLVSLGLMKAENLRKFYGYEGTTDYVACVDKCGFPKVVWREVREANDKEAFDCALWAHSLQAISEASRVDRKVLAKAVRCERPLGLRRHVW